jgi:acylphosphatase
VTTTIARRVVVHGHVQGVFFRDATRRAARTRGLAGWVRNRPDGTVEAWFEGPPADVLALVEWCRTGPSHALVTDVDVSDVVARGLGGFAVV